MVRNNNVLIEPILVEFLQTWGNPSKNEIYGKGEKYLVSNWAAEYLIRNNIAKSVQEEENAAFEQMLKQFEKRNSK